MKFLALLTFLIFKAPLSHAEEVIQVRADSWCPYNCQPGSEKPGYMIEILKEIFEPLGFKIDYQLLTWSRSIVEARKGSAHVIVGAAREDAPDFVFPKQTFGNSSACFFAKVDSKWQYKDASSLQQIKLGTIQGYAYAPEIEDYVKKNARNDSKIEWATGDDAVVSNIRKLVRGRVDAFIEDRQVVKMVAKAEQLEEAVKEVGCASNLDVYIAFSPAFPSSKRRVEILDEGLKKLRSSGRLNQILSRYGLQDWNHGSQVGGRE